MYLFSCTPLDTTSPPNGFVFELGCPIVCKHESPRKKLAKCTWPIMGQQTDLMWSAHCIALQCHAISTHWHMYSWLDCPHPSRWYIDILNSNHKPLRDGKGNVTHQEPIETTNRKTYPEINQRTDRQSLFQMTKYSLFWNILCIPLYRRLRVE